MWAVSAAELAGAALLAGAASFRAGAALLGLVAAAFVWTYARLGVPEAGLGSAGLLAALIGLALWRAWLAFLDCCRESPWFSTVLQYRIYVA